MPVWHRKGLVVGPPDSHPWWASCAGVPTCLPLSERLWRIWFGGRDAQGRSGILCVDVDPADGMKVLALRDVPGLQRGTGNAFDSAGIWACTALAIDGKVLLWYTGMRLGTDVPHELAIGLAISDDGGLTFRKAGGEPVLRSDAGMPQFVTTPCVAPRPEGGYEMWYSSCTEWRRDGARVDPWYELRYATSPDGLHWSKAAEPLIGIGGTAWAGITRPWVERNGATATLWFSARGGKDFRVASPDAYRLYRVPLHGTTVRQHEIEPVVFTPPPGPDDWDGWMQVCPCVLPYNGTRIMFYNGNDFSRTGFGYAIETNNLPYAP